MIHKDQDGFECWIEDTRNTLHKVLAQYDPESYEDCDISERLDIFDSWNGNYRKVWLEHVYEINLDAGVFCYQCCPAFHLANMPPENIFLRICLGREDRDHSEEELENEPPFSPDVATLYHLTPEEYEFNIADIWPPTISDDDLLSYEPRCAAIVSMAEMQDMLNLRTRLSAAEDLCLYLLRDCTVLIAQHHLNELYNIIALAHTWTSVYTDQYSRGAGTALFLACMSLLPFTTFCGPRYPEKQEYLKKLVKEAMNKLGCCWFPRRHICYTLGTHLLDDRNARYHVNSVVDHIVSVATPDTPNIIYGVVFSVFHCIVLRVDVAAGGTFKQTEVLDFLPPCFEDSYPWGVIPPTPGMILMTRLGHLAAADDVQFFYNNLSTRWWNAKRPKAIEQDRIDAVQETEPMGNYRSRAHSHLSLDIFFQIAYSIDNPQTLFNFAIASKVTMMASISRLRYPQFVSKYPNPHSGWPFCPNGGIFLSRLKDSDSDLFPTAFEFVHEEGSAFLQLMMAHEHGWVNLPGVVSAVNLCKNFPPTRRVGGEDLSNW